jgi:hypothetical protein
MVKIFAQYMQAQGASYGRSVQPARVMASIIERVEHARHRGQGPAAELPTSATIPPLMSMDTVAPVEAPIPPGNAVPTVAAKPHPVINPMFDVNQPANSITWRGGAGGRRGRRGQGVDNRRGQIGGNRLADRPVRCPNEAPPGTFCGYPNFPEAAKCGRCGIRNPYFKPLEQNNPPNYSQRGDQGRGNRGRGQGFRSRNGRKF